MIREKALGPDHPDVALALNNLAELYGDQGRYADALPLVQKTIASARAKLATAVPVLRRPRKKGRFPPTRPATTRSTSYGAPHRRRDRGLQLEKITALAPNEMLEGTWRFALIAATRMAASCCTSACIGQAGTTQSPLLGREQFTSRSFVVPYECARLLETWSLPKVVAFRRVHTVRSKGGLAGRGKARVYVGQVRYPSCGTSYRSRPVIARPAGRFQRLSMTNSPGLFVLGLSETWPGRPSAALFRRLGACCRLLRLVVTFACPAFVLQPAAAQEVPDEYPQCISHLWAAGAQLGRAEVIARHDASSEDAKMLESMHKAGEHVEKGFELCPKRPAPWPLWSNWFETRDHLTEIADKFYDGRMNRAQLAIALAGLYQSLATQLAFRVLPDRLERDATCVELYMRSGVALGFAQTATQLSQRLTPDAIVRLRQAVSLIYRMREMPRPCRDFQGLIPAINEALRSPNDPSIVGRVDDIWHAGELAAGPRTE